MRRDWVPLSASALVIGAMSLVFGVVLNPAEAGASSAEMLRVVGDESGRWLAMAVMYAFASFALTLGLPAVLTLFETRGRRLGLLGIALFMVGAVGTCGYSMLMVFFRALVVSEAVRGGALEQVSSNPGLAVFLQTWVIGFYGGVLLIAIALLISRATARWVPVLLILFVAMLPLTSQLGRMASAAQVLLLAIAFTGIATAAVATAHGTARQGQPAF